MDPSVNGDVGDGRCHPDEDPLVWLLDALKQCPALDADRSTDRRAAAWGPAVALAELLLDAVGVRAFIVLVEHLQRLAMAAAGQILSDEEWFELLDRLRGSYDPGADPEPLPDAAAEADDEAA